MNKWQCGIVRRKIHAMLISAEDSCDRPASNGLFYILQISLVCMMNAHRAWNMHANDGEQEAESKSNGEKNLICR